MLSLRAPLFSVSIAFAIGCLLGLDGLFTLPITLIILAVAGILWHRLARYERASLTAFYIFVASIGLTHTLLVSSTIAPNDLRRLPDDKALDTTQWRGVIIEEPVGQMSAHASRRTLDRTSFVVSIEAWRPTNGRLFDAAIDTPWQPAQGKVRCTLVGPAKELQCGDRIEWAALLEPIAPALSPGQLDFRAWEAARGVYYTAIIPALNWRRTATGAGNWLQRFSFRARDWAYERLQIGLEDDPQTADFLAGMLIGYRQQIPADIEQDFRRTGTLHVFAVSGQNIAEMLVVVMVLLQLCGLVRWRWAWTLAPVVLLYCLLTGSSSSAIRATVMALTILLAWKLGRPLNALGCWSLAFLAMLIWNPSLLLDPGAQLSFGVVLGLILIAPPLLRQIMKPFVHDPFLPYQLLTKWQKREEKAWYYVGALVAASIAATLVSEPITAIDFHQITPISVLANLLVVPVAGLITIVGTLSVAVSLFSTFLAALLNNANWLFAKVLILFVGFLAHQPGASINVPDLRTISSPAPAFIITPLQDSACLLVRTHDQTWLFNTGRENVARAATSHLLQFYGINQLDGLVLTQMSVADNSGAEILLRDFHPRQVITPLLHTQSPFEKSLPDLIAATGAKLTTWQQGHNLDLAPNLRLEVLHPSANTTATRAEDRSLVLLFHAGNQTLLWAGKIGAKTRNDLLAIYPNLHADVLVMGTEPPPERAWLQALGVRHWLQIPPRDRRLNSLAQSIDVPDFCQPWPLNQTGSVELHFADGSATHPSEITLRPWLAEPQIVSK